MPNYAENKGAKAPKANPQTKPKSQPKQAPKRPGMGARVAQKKRRKPTARRRWIAALVALSVIVLTVGAFVLVKKAMPKPVQVRMEYVDKVRYYAGDNGLEPEYVAAVIMAESSYDPNAVSSANAQGLMQIMPATGDWIAGKFDETYAEGVLFDPDVNMKYGCWYLSWLMNRYNGDMRCASSAYHQGHGTVDGWLQNIEYSADGATLSAIPSDATRVYVERILKYYERYKELYAAQE